MNIQLEEFSRRIENYINGINLMGGVFLPYEIQAMKPVDQVKLFNHLKSKGLKFKPLTDLVAKLSAQKLKQF